MGVRSNGIPKDPRPLSDKAYQHKCIKNVLQVNIDKVAFKSTGLYKIATCITRMECSPEHVCRLLARCHRKRKEKKV